MIKDFFLIASCIDSESFESCGNYRFITNCDKKENFIISDEETYFIPTRTERIIFNNKNSSICKNLNFFSEWFFVNPYKDEDEFDCINYKKNEFFSDENDVKKIISEFYQKLFDKGLIAVYIVGKEFYINNFNKYVQYVFVNDPDNINSDIFENISVFKSDEKIK